MMQVDEKQVRIHYPGVRSKHAPHVRLPTLRFNDKNPRRAGKDVLDTLIKIRDRAMQKAKDEKISDT